MFGSIASRTKEQKRCTLICMYMVLNEGTVASRLRRVARNFPSVAVAADAMFN